MKLRNKVIALIVSASIIIVIFIGICTIKKRPQQIYNNLPLYTSTAMWMYDTSTPEKAIGISQYVFVAKVNKILRTEYKNPVEIENGLLGTKIVTDPYTVYDINVIENIKGNLRTDSSIEFMQYGGINEDKKSYTFIQGGELLKAGEYYILLVEVFDEEGTIEVSDPNRIIPLENHNDINTASLSNDIISKYKQAYKNEIIPEGYDTNKKTTSKYDISNISD